LISFVGLQPVDLWRRLVVPLRTEKKSPTGLQQLLKTEDSS